MDEIMTISAIKSDQVGSKVVHVKKKLDDKSEQ
jgi:hypothetical protein